MIRQAISPRLAISSFSTEAIFFFILNWVWRETRAPIRHGNSRTCGPSAFDGAQKLVFFDGIFGADQNAADRSCCRRFDGDFHLHGFEDHDDVPALHPVAHLHFHFPDGTDHFRSNICRCHYSFLQICTQRSGSVSARGAERNHTLRPPPYWRGMARKVPLLRRVISRIKVPKRSVVPRATKPMA